MLGLKNVVSYLGKKAKNTLELGKKIIEKSNSQLPIPQSDNIYLELSKEVYKSPASRRENIQGYDYVPELSDAETAVYEGPKVIIAYRGSATAKDWLVSDRHILGGTEPSDARFKKAISDFNQIKQKFPSKTIVTTGHSLGARLGQLVSQHHNVKTVSFNAGCGLGCKTDYEKCKSGGPSWCRLKTSHRIIGDPISALDLYGNVKKYEGSGINRHSLDNFR